MDGWDCIGLYVWMTHDSCLSLIPEIQSYPHLYTQNTDLLYAFVFPHFPLYTHYSLILP